MTFSILTHDRETGIFAAAAATGSLCVGGWVLRGDISAGLVASQGTAPSSFWRDDGLRALHGGAAAEQVLARLTGADPGRGHRQMSALDRQGGAAAFTGADSVGWAGHFCAPGLAVAGNMLSGPEVLDALAEAGMGPGPGAVRMLAALDAAARAGGDRRGLRSAALLVLAPDRPPLDLRIDLAEDPITALAALSAAAHQSPYHDWLAEVPVLADPARAPAQAPGPQALTRP